VNPRLRIVDPFPGWDALQVGDMWRVPKDDFEGRECWYIVLPSIGEYASKAGALNTWHTTARSSNDAEGMWEVTGEPPNITVRPSINVMGDWHGWITDGELVPA
jgi:hypothetical protein